LNDAPEMVYRSTNIDDVQFVSYKRTSKLSEEIYRIIDKWELLSKMPAIDDYVDIGKDMIQILRSMETDDDTFPMDIIEVIERIISHGHFY